MLPKFHRLLTTLAPSSRSEFTHTVLLVQIPASYHSGLSDTVHIIHLHSGKVESFGGADPDLMRELHLKVAKKTLLGRLDGSKDPCGEELERFSKRFVEKLVERGQTIAEHGGEGKSEASEGAVHTSCRRGELLGSIFQLYRKEFAKVDIAAADGDGGGLAVDGIPIPVYLAKIRSREEGLFGPKETRVEGTKFSWIYG